MQTVSYNVKMTTLIEELALELNDKNVWNYSNPHTW